METNWANPYLHKLTHSQEANIPFIQVECPQMHTSVTIRPALVHILYVIRQLALHSRLAKYNARHRTPFPHISASPPSELYIIIEKSQPYTMVEFKQ